MTEFTFDQLSDEAKVRACENYVTRTNYPYDDWWDGVYEDFVQMADCFGLSVESQDIVFSGFWNQGDGASFGGYFEDTGPALPRIQQYAPKDTALHKLAERLDVLQTSLKLAHNATFACRIYRSGRYSHEYTMLLDSVRLGNEDDGDIEDLADAAEAVEKDFLDIFRDLAHWLYKTLEREHEYLTSVEKVSEILSDDDTTRYDEDGDII